MTLGWQEIILYAVFVIGTTISLFAFLWGRSLRRGGAIPNAVRNDPAFGDFLMRGRCSGGEIVVEAPSAKALLDALALQLENPMNLNYSAWTRMGQKLGQLHCDRSRQNELTFTAENLNVSGGLIRAIESSPGRTVRVIWAIELSGATRLITLGQLWALLLGLPASIAVPIIISKYVLPSSTPAVSGQFIQVIQVCQVLWEPFLFLGIASKQANMAGRYLETLISAAAFEVRTGHPAIPVVGRSPLQM